MTETPDPFLAALTAELGRKTGVCWLRYPAPPGSPGGGEPSRARAAWHVWFEDALLLVSGGGEQELPGLEHADEVEVTMRSKENGGRLLTWAGRASRITPDDPLWEPATAALVADRLNLPDLAAAAAQWAERSVVTRIVPTGAAAETPDSLSDDAHLAPPPPTPAATRGPLPRVLHRRQRRRPRLS